LPRSRTSTRGTDLRTARPAGAHRADEDDAPGRLAQQRQRGLRDRDLPDDVDLELLAQVVGREHLERAGNADARVVDEPVEPAADLGHRPLDRSGIGDVEGDLPQAAGRRGERAGVLRLADRGEHLHALPVEVQGGCSADAGRRAGDQDPFHRPGLPTLVRAPAPARPCLTGRRDAPG
jgi:hypothetical protein